ncbi:hypothetical protein, partial [Neisseria gonorrhoeae]|uniref:hypothetical protein n=3 Tax=Neisseria gonorrhoeae TaxID=485 RepID=UPI00111A4827
PTFVGMTNFRFLILVFCFCRNDEILSFRNLSEKTETAPPSFPRRRESRTWDNSNIQRLAEALEILDSRFRGNDEELRE